MFSVYSFRFITYLNHLSSEESMAILQLPAAGWSKEQLQYVVSLLEKYVIGHQKGVQVLCPKDLVDNSLARQQFISNVKSLIPPSYVNTFHAPISPHIDDHLLNLTSKRSVSYYRNLASIVKEAGGSVLVIHCNAVFSPSHWKEPLTDYGYVQASIFGTIQQNLREIAKDSPLTIAVENMPLPLKGDKTSDIKQIPFDPCLLTIEQMSHFLETTPQNVGFVFDTSHYGLMKNIVDRLSQKYGQTTTPQDIETEGIKGLYPSLIRRQPSLVDTFTRLQKTGRVVHVQMADAAGSWRRSTEHDPGELFIEGEEIGKGYLGEELLTLARTISTASPQIPISIDVNVQDFLHREEQVRSLQKVLQALRKS